MVAKGERMSSTTCRFFAYALDDIWCVFTAVFERSNAVVLG